MADTLTNILNPPDAPKANTGRNKGTAPAIRRLKERYPEMSEAKIAKRVGCSPSNVHYVLSAYLGDKTHEELRGYQDNRADIFDAIGARALSSITDVKLAKASPAELTTVMGILYDKARLERGQATGINVSVLLDVAEAIRARGNQRVISEPSAGPDGG
jgi:AraC-like DNA-binding protein